MPRRLDQTDAPAPPDVLLRPALEPDVETCLEHHHDVRAAEPEMTRSLDGLDPDRASAHGRCLDPVRFEEAQAEALEAGAPDGRNDDAGRIAGVAAKPGALPGPGRRSSGNRFDHAAQEAGLVFRQRP